MKVKKISGNEYLIQLKPDDDIHENLNAFAKQYKITTGVINGIGAIKDVTLGYFDLNKETYLQKSFPGSYEVIALNGNISMIEEDPFFSYSCGSG